MEPALHAQRWFTTTFGWLVGTTLGSGMALMMVVFGPLTMLTILFGYIIPQIRNMEDILPDHDQF